MAAKVDEKVYNRIIELHQKYGLTQSVIAERLGISVRTVRIYIRAFRTGTIPYRPDQDVPSISSTEASK